MYEVKDSIFLGLCLYREGHHGLFIKSILVKAILYSDCAASFNSSFPIMISVKIFSCLVVFALTSFPLSPSATPINTSPLSDNLFEKRQVFAVSTFVYLPKFCRNPCIYLRIQMHCTGQLYFTNAETSWMGLQSPSAWNYDREQWRQDQSEEGGKCECHDDGTLTCNPESLGGQHAAPRECETPCTCQRLDPGTPNITETVRHPSALFSTWHIVEGERYELK